MASASATSGSGSLPRTGMHGPATAGIGKSATLPRMGRIEEPPPGTPRYDTLPRSRSLPRPDKPGTRPRTMSLSMREKARMKRRINQEHNSNFRAGFVQVYEDQLIRTGIRGRKRYCLYCVLLLIGLCTLVNLLVTATIFLVLNFHGWKPAGLELVHSSGLTRFIQHTNLGHLILHGGRVSAPEGETLTLEGATQIKLLVDENQGNNRTSDNLSLAAAGVTLSGSSLELAVQDSLYLYKPGSKKEFYRLGIDNVTLRVPSAEKLKTDSIHGIVVTNKLKTKKVESDNVTLRGVEGAKARARKVDLYADTKMHLKSDDSIRIAARKGVILSKVSDIPLTDPGKDSIPSVRLCVCLQSGLLYAVEGEALCNEVLPEDIPC